MRIALPAFIYLVLMSLFHACAMADDSVEQLRVVNHEKYPRLSPGRHTSAFVDRGEDKKPGALWRDQFGKPWELVKVEKKVSYVDSAGIEHLEFTYTFRNALTDEIDVEKSGAFPIPPADTGVAVFVINGRTFPVRFGEQFQIDKSGPYYRLVHINKECAVIEDIQTGTTSKIPYSHAKNQTLLSK